MLENVGPRCHGGAVTTGSEIGLLRLVAQGLAGPRAAEALARIGVPDLPLPSVQPVPGPKFPSGTLKPQPTSGYAVRELPAGGFVRAGRLGYDLIVPRESVVALVTALDVPPAGLWAYEALRVAAGLPRAGFETDHRTLPSEVGLIEPAVHLDKGCYRGQETVARVHNLGRPPRRLVLLHLDGVSEVLAEPGTPVLSGTREVGRVGSVVRHHELGVIGLALVKQSVAMDAALSVAGSSAAIDPDDAPAETDDTLAAARERVRAVRSATIGR